ncbi:MAG: hypothetical protein LC104_02905 [Bacteroidales bacterium]|nr:hypothetical protein [Bacteroidales bacterium]
MSKVGTQRIAVFGAGPIGLEAALYALAIGADVQLFEMGQIGEQLLRWGFVRMFSPFGMNSTNLGRAALHRDQPTRELPPDSDFLTGTEYREQYLVPLAESSALRGRIQTQTRILAVGRTGWRKSDPIPHTRKPLPPFRVLLRDTNNLERIETFDVILDCTGTLTRPSTIGDGNIPAIGETTASAHMTYWPVDVLGSQRAHYAGKSIIVIGGGYTAATTICDLATLAEDDQATWTIWLTRGPRSSQPLPRIPADPLKERDRLAVRANSLASRGDGNLEFHTQTVIDEVTCHGPDQGFCVRGRVGGKPMSWDVERVIANVGYRPDLSIGSELRVHEPTGSIETEEPGYFVLGSKSHGRDANFLLREGYDQIRRAFTAITGKPGLDLYNQKAA